MAARKRQKKRMGPPPGPRAANVAETRIRILNAAVEQFAQNGFAGARVEAICDAANVNARMVYHYYADKAGLYVAVLEHVLSELRAEELKLDVSAGEPLEGLLAMFDFTFNHFASHPELIRLLSAENLMKGEFLRSSKATPKVASPVLKQIAALLKRGEQSGAVRSGIDPLHLYVMMVSLSYFHKSNVHTMSIIWDAPLQSRGWLDQYYRAARDMVVTYLVPPRRR